MKHYIILKVGLEVEADSVGEAAEMAESATAIPDYAPRSAATFSRSIPPEWRALKPSPLARINRKHENH